jgi:hypothetical protein
MEGQVFDKIRGLIAMMSMVKARKSTAIARETTIAWETAIAREPTIAWETAIAREPTTAKSRKATATITRETATWRERWKGWEWRKRWIITIGRRRPYSRMNNITSPINIYYAGV